jgi:hypothetical protein
MFSALVLLVLGRRWLVNLKPKCQNLFELLNTKRAIGCNQALEHVMGTLPFAPRDLPQCPHISFMQRCGQFVQSVRYAF